MPEITKPQFDVNTLNETDRANFDFVLGRITELKETRRDHFGVNLEKIWADADKEYVPHRLKTHGKRVLVTDEDKGWRSQLVTLGSDDWQSDVSQPNPYIKIQMALSILVDRNPTGVFSAGGKKFQATTALIKQLYQRSWEIAKSKQQLKLFIYNAAKYGWAVGRTYPLRLTRNVRRVVDYNEDEPAKSEWEKKEVVEYNDIFRENLDPWNTWIDDLARPSNPFSIRDWCWRRVYAWDQASEEFGKYPNWKFVQPGGVTTEKLDAQGAPEKIFKEKNLVEVYLYESRLKDLFMVVANGVPVVIEPLPVADAGGNKKLSLWQTFWTLRHAESPYGIGIYEAIRYEHALLDRFRNMTLDQLVLAIYKMFFFTGTQQLTETGDIKIRPGVGKQTLDPKNITWLNVPGPGAEAWQGLEMLQRDLDEASGITDPLMGVVTGKTAFEVAQAKEAALKRLKMPLDNIADALEGEAYITISLIQLLYSVPETHAIADPTLISAYLQEVQSDAELFERDEEGNFTAKVFREFPLNLEEDEKGNLIETEQTRFFRIKPRFLKWEGIVNVKPQSVLTPSKELDKALEMEMYNVLIPLLQPRPVPSGEDASPQLYGKIAKSIVKLYDQDPRDILPDSWLNPTAPTQPPADVGQELIVPMRANAPPAAPQTTAERLVPRQEIPQQPQSFAQRLVARLASPFRKVT